jgi:hypothetical protein
MKPKLAGYFAIAREEERNLLLITIGMVWKKMNLVGTGERG